MSSDFGAWEAGAVRIHARLARADEHLAVLRREITAYDSKNDQIEFRTDGLNSHGLPLMRLRVITPPDPAWELELSEAVHMWRSALDHCVALAAELNGHRRDDDRNRQFPIYQQQATYEKGGPRAPRVRNLSGTSESFRKLVDGFQPFTTPYPERHPLWVLADISNADKHRDTQVMGSTIRRVHVTIRTLSQTHVLKSDRYRSDMVPEQVAIDDQDRTIDPWELFSPSEVRFLSAHADLVAPILETAVSFGGRYLPYNLQHVRDFVNPAVAAMLNELTPT